MRPPILLVPLGKHQLLACLIVVQADHAVLDLIQIVLLLITHLGLAVGTGRLVHRHDGPPVLVVAPLIVRVKMMVIVVVVLLLLMLVDFDPASARGRCRRPTVRRTSSYSLRLLHVHLALSDLKHFRRIQSISLVEHDLVLW